MLSYFNGITILIFILIPVLEFSNSLSQPFGLAIFSYMAITFPKLLDVFISKTVTKKDSGHNLEDDVRYTLLQSYMLTTWNTVQPSHQLTQCLQDEKIYVYTDVFEQCSLEYHLNQTMSNVGEKTNSFIKSMCQVLSSKQHHCFQYTKHGHIILI